MGEKPLDLSVLPVLGAPIADTHAHLDMLEDPASALANAALAGVDFVVTVVDPTEEPERTFGEISVWKSEARRLILEAAGPSGHVTVPEVRMIIGAHPHNAKDFGFEAAEKLRVLATDALVAGIGEIGLDYHYDYSPRDAQRRVFSEQLETARQLGLPVVVHLREAHDDGEAILCEVGLPSAGCVLHCFTGDSELLDRFLEMGCYVSFAGPVTFKKADGIREAAARVPLERLLVETDCPFMAPEPFRGRKNEPALTVLTALRIAGARGIAPDAFARATRETSGRLFGRSHDRSHEGGVAR
jgi:TatD DNase family protein